MSSLDADVNDDLLCPSRESARAEAESLYRLIGNGTALVENVRELIAVPPKIESALREYASSNPADAHWIEGVLRFRKLVARYFERLVMRGCEHVDKPTNGEGLDGRGGADVCPDHGGEQAFADPGNPPMETMQEGCPQSLASG